MFHFSEINTYNVLIFVLVLFFGGALKVVTISYVVMVIVICSHFHGYQIKNFYENSEIILLCLPCQFTNKLPVIE